MTDVEMKERAQLQEERADVAAKIRGTVDNLLRELKRGKEMDVYARSSAGSSLIALLESGVVIESVDTY